ncbi:TetR/AcrR family transcriptional regulator [Mycobacteroides abscessus]|uniref:TetR family transcriptional regulator n=1 Tax=Mycobacteroides abscessus TaxID=36809 RepID=A0ABD7HHQ6_9MYCO|nr:TetR family transcriptional regulator [Mycobacteroides abscessus]AWG62823.1 TetR family transcriptional regulator [Mycobacteroides abscessus]PVA73721.1 TetR family transcriptional regulator [Mycobacteroides abscessus]PVB11939.1 TetR family transcriptional regulator [Mycobacteroides abscessus]PVB16632.1 TetR family transcriptional regulator [Mycobacteroides abscessus]RIR41881.1 TetR family transcriptional regulator [Mycobacteroides abscessus]
MSRLTRTQRHEQTREGLLDAAKKRFLEFGYTATSLEDIADDAGYSKGAVYSNFADKPTLCGEVLRLIQDERLAEMTAAMATAGPIEEQVEAVKEWFEGTSLDTGWAMLELEFVIVARDDPKLAAMIIASRKNAALQVRSLLDKIAESIGVTEAQLRQFNPDASLENLTNVLLNAGIGFGIQRAIDPSLKTQPATTHIDLTIGLLASLAQSTQGH